MDQGSNRRPVRNADWLAAFEALRRVYIDGAYSNMALNEAIPRHRGCRDSFVRNMVKGTIRQTFTLDYIADMLASDGIESIKPRTLIVIRMGLFALREMDSVPDHAAVSEAVELARRTAKGTDRFINAVLRSYIRRRNEFEPDPAASAADPLKQLSVRYSMPESLTVMIRDQYGEDTERILRGLNETPDLVLRVNRLKMTRDELIEALRERGIDASPADGSELAVIAKGSGIVDSDLYREGIFSVQSLSSIIAVEALSPAPGSNVLDMCAAPGGKSIMMAELMDNTGSITSCDIYEHRLGLIEASAKRTGAEIITVRQSDGTVFDSSLEGRFDCVLADVPCSGLGDMGTKPEIRLRTDPGKYPELTDIQLEILRNAVRYAKPGGRICYSTCTINRDENEGVIERFDGFARILEMNTILPYNNTIGFYYCILEKFA